MQSTIPYRIRAQRGSAGWAANNRPDGRKGSSLYELNLRLWMWGFSGGQENKVHFLQAMEAQAKCLG